MKHVYIVLLLLAVFCSAVSADTLTIHYFRHAKDYSPWNLWVWTSTVSGHVVRFTGDDSYGKLCSVNLDTLNNPEKIGFIVRTDSWDKDIASDRYWEKQKGNEIWLVEGDGKIYYSVPDTSPVIKGAFIDAKNSITVVVSTQVPKSRYSQFLVKAGKHTVYPKEVKEISKKGEYLVVLPEPIDISRDYTIFHPDYKQTLCLPRNIFLTEFVSEAEPGVHFEKNETVFRIFAPRADSVKLRIYDNADEDDGNFLHPANVVCLKLIEGARWKGMWECRVKGNQHRKYYRYFIDGSAQAGAQFNRDYPITDPYAVAQAGSYKYPAADDSPVHNGKGIIFDFSRLKNPVIGFGITKKDLIVYEANLRDFTVLAEELSETRGKYEGMVSKIRYLKKLGITALELLPVHEFNNSQAPAREHPDNLTVNHWGYMTKLYFAPESYYASSADGSQIVEFRDMVNELHRNKIAVIMDVVYNHTGIPEYLSYIDKAYYYRLNADGAHNDRWTGCGNTVNTDYPMAQNLVVDSLHHFIRNYGINGFRFDLAAALSDSMLKRIADDPVLKNAIMIGEPWDCSSEGYNHFIESTRDTRWSAWNDFARNTFQNFLGNDASKEDLAKAVRGISPFGSHPETQVNYIECHDNYTMYDRLHDVFGKDTPKQLCKAGIVMTALSRGIPMIHSGQEFGRSKRLNELKERSVNWEYNGRHMWENTYNRDSRINWIDWNEAEKSFDMCLFTSKILQFRKQHPEFFMPGDNFIPVSFPKVPARCFQWTYSDGNRKLTVIINVSDSEQSFVIGKGIWKSVLNDKIYRKQCSVNAQDCQVLFSEE